MTPNTTKPTNPKKEWRLRVHSQLGDAMYGGALRVTRRVTMKECDWLDFDFNEGDIVYGFGGSMGTISLKGWAVTVEPNEYPFYELPLNALERMDRSYYLIKRSAEFAKNSVIVKRDNASKEFSESSINKRPSSSKLKIGDEIFVAETSYGIYASGIVTAVSPIIAFTTIEEILKYHSENHLNDEKYWFDMAKKLQKANTAKSSILYYQSYRSKITLLNRVRTLHGDLSRLSKIQNSFVSLDEGIVDVIKKGESSEIIALNEKIPGHLRFQLYSMFNTKTSLGYLVDVDHFVPKIVGGPGNIIENLVPVGFSLNRYKGSSIPKGLFVVSSSYDDLKVPLLYKILCEKDDYISTAIARDLASKICNRVNTWSIDDAKQFYLQVLRHHHPMYASIIDEWRSLK